MSIKIINKERSKGYVAEGPNENPLKHICLVKNIEKTESNITTAFDVSGSQNCTGGVHLINYMNM